MALTERKCESCRSAKSPLSHQRITALFSELTGWNLDADRRLGKSYKTKNFATALAFANKIGALADEENHHPDLLVRWGELKVELWTHKINGLSEADFILAAKIDGLQSE
jgi:4a-hydroxytetrahydrobiopterin dehydratase